MSAASELASQPPRKAVHEEALVPQLRERARCAGEGGGGGAENGGSVNWALRPLSIKRLAESSPCRLIDESFALCVHGLFPEGWAPGGPHPAVNLREASGLEPGGGGDEEARVEWANRLVGVCPKCARDERIPEYRTSNPRVAGSTPARRTKQTSGRGSDTPSIGSWSSSGVAHEEPREV